MINLKKAIVAGATGTVIGLGSLGFAATAAADTGSGCANISSTHSTVRCSMKVEPTEKATPFVGKNRYAEVTGKFSRATTWLGEKWAREGLI